MASKVMTWQIFGPERDPRGVGFRGVVRGKSNNKLLPNQCPDMYNYLSDGGPVKRKGNSIDNDTELTADTGIWGLFQFYNGSEYKTFAKCGPRIFDVEATGGSAYLLTSVTEAGDASNQMSSWSLTGAGNSNTNGGVLYWKLTDAAGTRTVDVYKNSDGAAGNKVATGSRSGDGSVTLAAANDSSISGSVTVAYSGDDTTLSANTLTFVTLTAADEIQFTSWFSNYFFADGTNIYNGTTGAATAITFLDEDGVAISGITPHGKSILERKQRFYITRDPSYPTYVYYSQSDSWTKYNTDGGANVQAWVACGKSDGKSITGFIMHDERILVTKQQNHYWIDGEPTDDGAGTLTVSDPIPGGAYDQKTLVDCPDGFIRGWGPDGVWQYSSGTGWMHISENIDYELLQIAESDKSKVCAGWHDHYYVLMLPNGISDYCDGFMFDTRIGEWFPIKNWNISCVCSFEDGTLHAGFYDEGYICQLFDGTTDNSGAEDITCYLKTKTEIPPGYAGKKFEHNLDKLQMFNIRNGQSFTLLWNANEGRASGSWSFTLDDVGTFLGEFELGDDAVADSGDLLISDDELSSISTNPSSRPESYSSQRFTDIYFEVTETGAIEHGFDYLQVASYPIGEVR